MWELFFSEANLFSAQNLPNWYQENSMKLAIINCFKAQCYSNSYLAIFSKCPLFWSLPYMHEELTLTPYPISLMNTSLVNIHNKVKLKTTFVINTHLKKNNCKCGKHKHSSIVICYWDMFYLHLQTIFLSCCASLIIFVSCVLHLKIQI